MTRKVDWLIRTVLPDGVLVAEEVVGQLVAQEDDAPLLGHVALVRGSGRPAAGSMVAQLAEARVDAARRAR